MIGWKKQEPSMPPCRIEQAAMAGEIKPEAVRPSGETEGVEQDELSSESNSETD